jgi:hypothetical protein
MYRSVKKTLVERRQRLGFHRDAAPLRQPLHPPLPIAGSHAPPPDPSQFSPPPNPFLLRTWRRWTELLWRRCCIHVLMSNLLWQSCCIQVRPPSTLVSTQKLDPVVLCSLHTCFVPFQHACSCEAQSKKVGLRCGGLQGRGKRWSAAGGFSCSRIRNQGEDSSRDRREWKARFLLAWGRTGELLCSSLFIWLINYHVLARQL